MFWIDLLYALVTASVLSLLLIGLAGWRHPSTGDAALGFVLLFLSLFFATWAAAAWAGGWGPLLWGSYWLPFVIFGIVLALALAAFVPPRGALPRDGAADTEGATASGTADAPSTQAAAPDDVPRAPMDEEPGSGSFAWLLILGMAVLVVIAYSIHPA